MEDHDTVILYGWLDLYSDSSSGAWGKLSGKKQWKRKFIALKQLSSNEDDIFLHVFDKEEHWKVSQPKKSLSLFPRYRVCKLNDFKGRDKVLEVNNETEQWYFASDKSKVINLWACQIQMQTKLCRILSGRIFSVSGAINKDMQSIGAAQQKCLLHFTKWGITLALQDSRAILAMWPIKTIRNYETTNQCEFTIEAGRKSPMGEGVYKFYTNVGQDREMFNVIDNFVAAILDEKATYTSGDKTTQRQDDALQTYDQLHKSAIGFNVDKLITEKEEVDTAGYSHIGSGVMTTASTPAKIQRDLSKFSIHRPPAYDHLYGDDVDFTRVDVDEKKHSISSYDSESPRGLSFTEQNYDKLGGRNQSWGASSTEGLYDHINQKKYNKEAASSYDQINRSSFKTMKSSYGGTAGYPLRDEPSVPCLDSPNQSFKGTRSPIQQTPEGEKFIFRNSIYTPIDDEASGSAGKQNVSSEIRSRHSSVGSQNTSGGIEPRHGSTASEGGRSVRRGISINERSIQDIADHFMYQVPSSLHSTTGSVCGDVYENTASSQQEQNIAIEPDMTTELIPVTDDSKENETATSVC